MQVAERQAERLLALLGVTTWPVPTELVARLPHISVTYERDIPVYGSAHWDGKDWIVVLNADEPIAIQRTSLMHELKHIIDHPFREFIAASEAHSGEPIAERTANYFALCFLMPADWATAAFRGGTQAARNLAETFEISPGAAGVRLGQLGLLGYPTVPTGARSKPGRKALPPGRPANTHDRQETRRRPNRPAFAGATQ